MKEVTLNLIVHCRVSDKAKKAELEGLVSDKILDQCNVLANCLNQNTAGVVFDLRVFEIVVREK